MVIGFHHVYSWPKSALMSRDPNHNAVELLRMVAPERHAWMQELLGKYEPSFCEGHDKTEFVLQASRFGFVQFTSRTILHVWLLAWVMWREMYCWSSSIYFCVQGNEAFVLADIEQLSGQRESYEKADALLSDALAFLNSEPIDWNRWPASVPKPAGIPLAKDEDQFINDLVHYAIAFFLLHELRHLIVHKDGTAFPRALDEEFECDSWAAQYLLARSEDYARDGGENAVLVKSKRAMGVVLGTVVIAHVHALGLWEAGAEHPAIAERIKRLTDHLDLPENDHLWNVASSFLLASLRRQNVLPERIEMRTHRDLFSRLLCQPGASSAV